MREALDLGGELFNWEEKKQLSGRRQGTKVTGVGIGLSPFTAGSAGRDGLLVIRPDGKLYVHQGIGNLGTHSISDTARPAADVLDLSWDQVVIVWGDTSKHLPFSTVQAGSQTTHAHTRANHAAATALVGLLQELAAGELGGSPGDYRVADGRVYRAGNRAVGMDFAGAAHRAIALGGKFSGGEFPEDLNDVTKAAVTGLAGQGLVAAARDNYPREGAVFTWVASFAQVELDVETGEVEIVDLASTADCGTVMHPRSLAAQTNGGVFQGIGMAKSQRWVFDPSGASPSPSASTRRGLRECSTFPGAPVSRRLIRPTRTRPWAQRGSVSRRSVPGKPHTSAQSRTPWAAFACAAHRLPQT